MYINYDDYGISKDPVENGFEVDDLVAPAISILNKKGYRTAFCCSGHVDGGHRPELAYISFWFGETPPEYLPKGWRWDSDGQMEYEYEHTGSDTLQKEIESVMSELTIWADGLPDLNE